MLGHVRIHAVCGSGLRVIIGAMREFEFCRRMPQEAHLDAVRDAAGVRPNPRLVLVEDDPDLARPVTGLGAGGLAIVKVPSVAGNERAAVVDPVANRLEVPRPRPLSRQGSRRGATLGHRGGRTPLRSCRPRRAVGSTGSNSMHVASAKPRSAQVQAVTASSSATPSPIRSGRGSRSPRRSSPFSVSVPLLRRNGMSKRVSVPAIGSSVSSPKSHSRTTGRS